MSTSCITQRHEPDELACLTQFSLATYFFCMSLLAVTCVVFKELSCWLSLPYGMLIAARIACRLKLSSNLAWGLFFIGWVFVLGNICARQLNCFMIWKYYYPWVIARSLLHEYLIGIAFPLVCSAWTLPLLVEGFVKRRSPVRKWLVLFLLMANIDLGIMAFFISKLVREATWS